MASQCLVVLSLFVVLVGTTMAAPQFVEYHTIDYYNNEQVQFLGRYAVDVINKKTKSHLIFKEVVNGTVTTIPPILIPYRRIWDLILTAINCSESGSPSKYAANVFENLFPGEYFGNEIKAYGSNFTALDYLTKIN